MVLLSSWVSACLAFSLASTSSGSETVAQNVQSSAKTVGAPSVVLETNYGNITLQLRPESAPVTAANFLKYVGDGYYDGTVFHRVIPGFMIQGGGLTSDLERKPAGSPIKNEAGNGLHNKKGWVAMARTHLPHSATSQFFINLQDNAHLDFRSPEPSGIGYAVFAQVIQGMSVVEKIASLEILCPSRERTPCQLPKLKGMRDVPKDSVLILRAYLVQK